MDANRYCLVRRFLTFVLVIASVSAAETAQAQTAWKARVAYRPGTVVTYQGWTAVCAQAHASQYGWEPPNAPALWSIQGPRAAYAAATPTATTRPITMVAHVTATPAPRSSVSNKTTPDEPLEVALTPAPRPTGPRPWAANTSYTVGDVVSFGGSAYRCRLLHMAVSGWEPSAASSLWTVDPS